MTATTAIDTAGAGTALTTKDAARVKAALEAGTSANTRRACRKAWADSRGIPDMPAPPEAVAA